MSLEFGCLPEEFEEKVSVAQFYEYLAYFNLKADEEKKAHDKAKSDAKRK
jgi:hypothetical protein